MCVCVCVRVCVCGPMRVLVFHYCDKCCECYVTDAFMCVIRLPCIDKPFMNGKIHFLMFPRRLNLGHCIIVA